MEAGYEQGTTAPRRVSVDGWDYTASDVAAYEDWADQHGATAEEHRERAKSSAQIADNYRSLAQRIREELARTEPITLNTRSLSTVNGSVHGSSTYLSVPLSNGNDVLIGTRVCGPYEGTGLWLDNPPKGYEWAVVRDDAFEVLILRKREANVGHPVSNTPDDRYTW